MTEPDIVPDVAKNIINIKVLSVIIAITIAIYFSMQIIDEDTISLILFPISVLFTGAAAIAALFVSKQHWGTAVFGKSYLTLGIGYLFYTIAEITFYVLDFLGYDNYPSIADVFFFLVYPCMAIHLFLNLRFFGIELTKVQKIWMPIVSCTVVASYVILSIIVQENTVHNDYLQIIQEFGVDFYYGLIIVSASAVILAMVILGSTTFRTSLLGTVWLLLLVGFLINTFGDVWYYHLEIFGMYTDQHVVNVIWYLSNMVVIYALYKHKSVG